MRVLLYDTTNAFLTPGGKTTHALKLHREISKMGVDIQFARWWDESQKDVDIIHFLSPSVAPALQAKARGIKTFYSMIFDFETNRRGWDGFCSRMKARTLSNLPFGLSKRFGYWNALKYMDKIQFMHEYDREAALRYFPGYIQRDKTLIIPHAYDPSDINSDQQINLKAKDFPAKYLVSCANISERKQPLLLAKYAKLAKVPIVFLGSYVESSPYFAAFKAEIDNKYVIYPGYVSNAMKDTIEREASGFVLLSKGESGCIAVYEAAGHKLPLLLSNLPWAWGYEQPKDISFCSFWKEKESVRQLQDFYERAHRLDHMPFCAKTWENVASIYFTEYKKLLGSKL